MAMKPSIKSMKLDLEPSWKALLHKEFEADYMISLKEFLVGEYQAGKTIYPRGKEYFTALNSTPFPEVSVVILGQDPYHGPGQAHGLSFSVLEPTPIPPSLKNIFLELKADLGLVPPRSGNLLPWAKQGVLLLNATLTVEKGLAGSHQKKGWERFTDTIIKLIAADDTPKVFMLWGSYAIKKAEIVTRESTKHLILTAPHPSPLSAHRGFLGCRHFSKANAFLTAHLRTPINWSLASDAL